VAGDFDGDGDTDIALLGGPGWSTIPMAFSNRNGTFTVTNLSTPSVPQWAQLSGVKAAAGDFDGDGDADIALVGHPGWGSIPVAFSSRNGTFTVSNTANSTFPSYAQQGAQAFAGDFNGDGVADIALTGVPGWNSIPVAFSNRAGGFSVTNTAVTDFPGWASTAGAKIAVGDFNGDGAADLAAVGGSGWRSFTFALSNRAGGFASANLPNPTFAGQASAARFALGVRANAGGTADLILLGGAGWSTVPVAFLSP
jgi:FG-GAP-like repeat